MTQSFHKGDRVRRNGRGLAYAVKNNPFEVEEVIASGTYAGWVRDKFAQLHSPHNLELVSRNDTLGMLAVGGVLRGHQGAIVISDETEPSDPVNHPGHYKANGLEAIDVLEAFGLVRDGRLFNVGKYVLRAGKKDDELQDLKKARWYLDRLIADLEERAA